MRILVLIGCLALLLARPAGTCCMVPMSFAGDVDQSAQRVIAVHHDGHQELIARVAPFFQGTDDTPAYLAWVLTVPSKPTGYDVVAPEVFKEAAALADRLEALAARQEARRSRFFNPVPKGMLGVDSMQVTAAARGGLDVSAPVEVGPYEITEVKARGVDALDQLNAYLDARGFPQEDPAHMRWFVENDFTFLCIYITPPEGQDRLGKQLELDALRVGFAAERPYYPGMFSSRQGNFSLALTVVTSKPLAASALNAQRGKLNARSSDYRNLWTVKAFPGALGKSVADVPPLHGVERWYVNALHSRGFNRNRDDGTPEIAHWREDVFFALGGEADEPPSWYYGDRDIGAVERAWREHRIAIVIWTALIAACVTAIWIVRRKRRLARA